MSFSLYGALPPSKTGKDSEKSDSNKPKSTSSTGMSGLYSSLPAPESGSTAFQASVDATTGNPTAAPTITETQSAPVGTSKVAAAAAPQPTGWSAFNKFRPVVRRPTIQAKPKLNKPFIPAGATIVSEKTVTKEEKEKELQQQQQQQAAAAAAAAAASKSNIEAAVAQPKNDNIDLGAIPFLTSADDVNGFRANQKSKKKGKKGKSNVNSNTQPLPTVFNMLEDYDPHKPNDYEQYKEERREMKEQQRKRRDWERRRNRSRSRSRSYSRSRSRSRSYSRSRSRSRSRSPRSRSRSPYYSRSQSPEPAYRDRRPPPVPTHQEPPKINVRESAEDAYKRRMMMSQPQQQIEPPRLQPPARNDDINPAHDIAQKILAKYGWQEGQGLGKDEAGMKEAIEVKPTGRGTGVFVDHSARAPPPAAAERKDNVSPVILLTNMVGPGEVDDMLQEETADECSKYGKVERCLIFEVPKGKIPDDRAVRIFVKFSDVESAKKAIQDLNGRFFGGRIVTAAFFDNSRFEKLDLAPSREEFYQNA